MRTDSSALITNHHLVARFTDAFIEVRGVVLYFLLTVKSPADTEVRLEIAFSTAQAVVVLRVPQILLAPLTGAPGTRLLFPLVVMS